MSCLKYKPQANNRPHYSPNAQHMENRVRSYFPEVRSLGLSTCQHSHFPLSPHPSAIKQWEAIDCHPGSKTLVAIKGYRAASVP